MPEAKKGKALEEKLRRIIRDVPDFPKPGILFKDITPLLGDPELLRETVEAMAEPFRKDGISQVLGIESRGFIFGPPLAVALGAGFVPARKPGKLPSETVSAEYILEYGVDALEMHADALADGARVLIHDDLLATGGTAAALAELVEGVGGNVAGFAFLVELEFLEGRRRLDGYDVHALISYDGE